jgi:hypothetical protein
MERAHTAGELDALGKLRESRHALWLRILDDAAREYAAVEMLVVRKDGEPKIALDRSKLRVIDLAEGNRIDYYLV